MNKNELIASVAEKAGFSKKDGEKALTAVIESISDALKSGDKVQLVGFGTFETKHRAARTCKNPSTGESIDVPATNVPAFKAGKALKDLVK